MHSRFITAMWVLVLLVFLQVHASNTYGMQYGSSAEIFAYTRHSTAYHIEQDLANEDQLMISTYGALKTIRPGSEASLIVGDDSKGYREGIGSNARFYIISGFRQVNTTHVIMVDQMNHCLRYVDRVSKSTSPFAGKCEESGYVNGQSTEARFYKPYNFIDGYYLNEFYLTDTGNNVVRHLILTSEQITVSTLIQSPSILNQPIGIALNCKHQQLYVSVQFGVVQIDIKQRNFNLLSSSDEGFFDGDLQSSKFGTISKIVPISSSLYLIADYDNKALRVLDVDHWTVETLHCSQEHDSNDQFPCAVTINFQPYSISFSSGGDKLFIGQKNNIKVIAMNGVSDIKNLRANCSRLHRPTTTTTTTTTTRIPPKNPDSLVGVSSDNKPISEKDWALYLIIGLLALMILLIVVGLLVIRKLRRRRNTSEHDSIPPYLAPNATGRDGSASYSPHGSIDQAAHQPNARFYPTSDSQDSSGYQIPRVQNPQFVDRNPMLSSAEIGNAALDTSTGSTCYERLVTDRCSHRYANICNISSSGSDTSSQCEPVDLSKPLLHMTSQTATSISSTD